MNDKGPSADKVDVGTLPDVIPLFPLSGVILLPRSHLPLNIFEPRYLAMVRDALEGDSVIGMIQPREASTPPSEPPLFQVGCLGRIVQHEDTPDGRILLALEGLARFKITEELARITPYRKAQVSYDAFNSDGAEASLGEPEQRETLIETLKKYLDMRGLQADWDALSMAPDERLINAMAMICPFEPGEKQALIEAGRLDERADLMITLMNFALQAGTGPGDRPH
jgi:Lon protease-like protein